MPSPGFQSSLAPAQLGGAGHRSLHWNFACLSAEGVGRAVSNTLWFILPWFIFILSETQKRVDWASQAPAATQREGFYLLAKRRQQIIFLSPCLVRMKTSWPKTWNGRICAVWVAWSVGPCVRRGLDPGAEPHYWFVELVEHVCHTDDKENHQKSGAGGGACRESRMEGCGEKTFTEP